MKKLKLFSFAFGLAIVFIFLFSSEVSAQCAMCRAVPGSNHAGGGHVGEGLNTGIMYLLIVPYVLLMIGAYMFFKKPIDEKIKKILKRNS